ncbi:MAG TPA: biotin--[acetyl-CoA-carboxylase] ligase [Stellaceae bacterium]|nr:biotin--[acetyl-CoA-carboxylase] ligase [Stellaceae bacterium]
MSGALLPPFFRLLRFERIDSTNDEAKRLAASGAAEGALVLAREQSAGRGRRGRAWLSPPGNLYCSVLLRPAATVRDAAQLGFAASLAIAEAASQFLPRRADVACKWPNDVLIDGAKVAGILMESRAGGDGTLDWLVLGIGVNLVSHPEGTEHQATSLLASGAGEVTVDAFLPALAERFLAWYEAWRRENGFASLRSAWLERAHGLGHAIRVRLQDREIEGSFAGLDTQGRLVLDAPDGRRHISAAEIFPAA